MCACPHPEMRHGDGRFKQPRYAGHCGAAGCFAPATAWAWAFRAARIRWRLLRLLVELRGPMGIALAVLHFNHQLRGAESDADEEFVAALAAGRGPRISGWARRRGRRRRARAAGTLKTRRGGCAMRFSRRRCKPGRVTHVAVGHTADDQAETVLARLVRGPGPRGLRAIYPVKGHVVRPLLEMRRGELRAYLERLGQGWREDASNLDTTRLRARLRHEVLPVIERELQPAMVAHLWRLAQMAREDEAFWTALVAERVAALARREEGRLGIRCCDLLAPQAAAAWTASVTAGHGRRVRWRKRLVRGVVEELRGERYS